MAKFLVHGGYYSRNYGDFILIDKTIKAIRLASPDACIGLAMAPKIVRDEFDDLDDITFLSILKVDKVIFTGGGYLGERDYKVFLWSLLCLYRQIFLPLICIFLGKPYSYFGIEVGPLRYKFLRKIVGFILDRAEKVIVRNKFSLDFCSLIMKKKNKVILGTDFAQNKKFLERYKSDVSVGCDLKSTTMKKKIGIHVTSYLPIYKTVNDSLCDYFAGLASIGYDLIFFTDSPAHDNLVNDNSFLFKDLYNHSTSEFIPYQGPQNTTCLLMELDGIVTSKLHVGIIGLTFGAVPLSLPSHNKTPRYYDQVNLPELCLYKKDIKSQRYAIDRFDYHLKLGKKINLPCVNIAREKQLHDLLIDFVTC